MDFLKVPKLIVLTAFLCFLVSFILCFYVYFYGNELKIMDVYPFEDGKNIGYFITFNCFLLIILLAYLFLKYRTAKQLEKEPKDETEAKLLALAAYNENQLQQLQERRGNSSLPTKNFLYQVPWFLVLGKQGSGKSTLVDHFYLREKMIHDDIHQDDDSHTYPIQWTVANDTVFIDVEGALWEEQIPEQATTWQSFKHWIAAKRPEKPLNGLLLTISVEDLIYSTVAEQRQSASALRNRIQQLNDYYACDIPVYIALTKFDLLEGFSAFFKAFDKERIEDIFGFSLPLPDDQSTSWQTAYETQFATLVRRLNRYLVHDSDAANTELSTQYYAFIRQMIGLKQPLLQLLQVLLAKPPLPESSALFVKPPFIRGLYFTTVVEQQDAHHQQAFFAQHLPERLLLPEAWMASESLYAPKIKQKRFVATYVLSGLLISSVTALLLYLYEKNSWSVQQPLAAIEQYTQLKPAEHNKHKNSNVYLHTLDILRAEMERYQTEKTRFSQLKNLGFYRDDEVAQGVTASYQRLLAQGFSKILVEEQVSALEKYLQTDQKDQKKRLKQHHSVQDTLAWLRVIRLISESPTGKTAQQVEELIAYRQSLVRPWMIDYWQKRYQDTENSGSLQTQLLKHFDYALQHTGVKSDATLNARIRKLQTQLAKVSLVERLYSQLKMEAQRNAPPFQLHYELGAHFFEVFAVQQEQQQKQRKQGGKQAKEENKHRLTINPFFTKAGFSQYYLASHEQLVKLVSLDAWVLGRKATPNEYTYADLQQIRAEISDLYVRDYEQQWFTAIDALKLLTFDEMNDAVRFLKAVSAKNNPYKSLVTTVRANTIFTDLYAKTDKQETVKAAKKDEKTAAETEQAKQKALKEREIKAKAQTAKKISLRLQDSFQYINELGELTAAKKPYINEMNLAFANLYKYMAKIQKASANKKSLNKVLEGLNKAGTENPIDALRRLADGLQDPWQSQLYQIADSSGRIIMNLATTDLNQAINQAWQKDVYSYYMERIKGKYPLSPAGDDVSLQDFKAFFAPKGILATFYQRYLEKIATGEQEGVTLSPVIVDLYKQAEAIKTGFFNEAGDYHVAYTIETMELSNVYRNAVLNIDGVEITYNHGKPVQKKMLWPNPTQEVQQTSLTLNPLQKDVANEYERVSGDWAWFRFIDRAATISLSDQIRDIRFHTKTGVADYRITVPQAMSPLTKDLLGRFTVPSKLTKTSKSSGAKE